MYDNNLAHVIAEQNEEEPLTDFEKEGIMGKSFWSLEEIIDSLSDIVDLEIWDSASRLFPYLNR